MKNFARKLRKVVFFVLVLPLLLLMRLLRTLVLIRLFNVRSDRIGHFSGNVEVYLCERRLGMHKGRIFDLFYRDGGICNHQLMKMWRRVIPIYSPHRFWTGVAWANRKFPDAKTYEYGSRYFDSYGVLEKTEPSLKFTPEEEQGGWEKLRELGIPTGKPFVGFIVRDRAYLASKNFKGQDFSYHDYRDTDIEKYNSAIKGLSQAGYYTVRMGAVVKNKLSFSYPGLIDYAGNGLRDDFKDVFLAARCNFFIFSESGLGVLAMVFRRPVICLDLVPMRYAHAWGSNYLLTFRKLWLKKEKRFLKFREIVHSEIGKYNFGDLYKKAGIELIENSAEEVADAIDEMKARCEGTWQTNEEYEDLQQRFWEIYKDSKEMFVLRSRVGSKFLLQNQDLL